jgi:multiple sugar transport system permease protein
LATTPPLTGTTVSRQRFDLPAAARRFAWLSDRRLVILFVAPAILWLFALFIFPLLWAFVLSFTDYSASRTRGGVFHASWIWFENYADVLTSGVVRQRALNTTIFVVGAVLLQTILGFALAYLISVRRRGKGLMAVVFMLPMMLSPVIVGAFWRFVLEAQYGLLAGLARMVGETPIPFLTRPNLAMASLIVVDSWQWTPFIMVIALAGLSAVPRYLYEAAEIDRASEWFKFRQITWPLVWPLLLIAIMFRAIDAFRLFDIVYVVTGGGPAETTETLSFDIYQRGLQQYDTGLASAYGILTVILVTVAAQILVKYQARLAEK